MVRLLISNDFWAESLTCEVCHIKILKSGSVPKAWLDESSLFIFQVDCSAMQTTQEHIKRHSIPIKGYWDSIKKKIEFKS